MNRSLITVIDEMLVEIPAKNTDIIYTLKDIQESQRCRAPEDMLGWELVSEMLNTFEFNRKTPEWQLKICSIFSTYPLEEIKKQCQQL